MPTSRVNRIRVSFPQKSSAHVSRYLSWPHNSLSLILPGLILPLVPSVDSPHEIASRTLITWSPFSVLLEALTHPDQHGAREEGGVGIWVLRSQGTLRLPKVCSSLILIITSYWVCGQLKPQHFFTWTSLKLDCPHTVLTQLIFWA